MSKRSYHGATSRSGIRESSKQISEYQHFASLPKNIIVRSLYHTYCQISNFLSCDVGYKNEIENNNSERRQLKYSVGNVKEDAIPFIVNCHLYVN